MQVTLEVVLSAGAAVLALALAVGTWQFRARAGASALAAFNAGIAIWSGGNALQHAAVTLEGKLLWVGVQYVGIAIVPVAWFAFACQYTGRERWVRPPRLVVLSVPMVVLAVLSWTNPDGLVRASAIVTDANPVVLERTFGPAFWAGWLYSNVLNVASTALLLAHVARTTDVYRFQTSAVIVGMVVPWVAHLGCLGGLLPVEPEPFFVVTGAAFALAITRYRFLDLSPVARNALVERTDDAMFVCDADGRLVDANPAAVDLLGRARADVLGLPASEAFANVPEIAACVAGDEWGAGSDEEGTVSDEEGADSNEDGAVDAVAEDPVRTEPNGGSGLERDEPVDRLTLVVAGETRHYDVRLSTLGGGETLVVLHDVTALVERERALARQNDRLETVASTLSHDLRNPLAVARGHVELARETGDTAVLETAETGLDRMDDIVDDVLALARTGEPNDTTVVDVGTAARTAWGTVETGDATLSVTETTTVDADEGLLVQLLENLFRNSVEHGSTGNRMQSGDSVEHGSTSSRTASDDSVEQSSTPDGGSDAGLSDGDGSVSVTVGLLGDGSGFFVADDGPGIPDSVRGSLFQRGTTTREDGTGIGLAIVERVADAHGWTVDVAESETGGARFEIRTGA